MSGILFFIFASCEPLRKGSEPIPYSGHSPKVNKLALKYRQPPKSRKAPVTPVRPSLPILQSPRTKKSATTPLQIRQSPRSKKTLTSLSDQSTYDTKAYDASVQWQWHFSGRNPKTGGKRESFKRNMAVLELLYGSGHRNFFAVLEHKLRCRNLLRIWNVRIVPPSKFGSFLWKLFLSHLEN